MVELWVNADTGDDNNPGTETQPLATPQAALYKLSGVNDLVHMKGIFYGGLKPQNYKYSGHVIFDGHNEALLYAFDGAFQNFDPEKHPNRSYGNLNIMDIHNFTIRNCHIWGGIAQGIHLDDSYSSIGIKNVHLENVRVRYAGGRGIFMGGNNIEGIYIDDCEVKETCYGDTTHNIYLSGGHWDGSYPPIRKIRIRNT